MDALPGHFKVAFSGEEVLARRDEIKSVFECGVANVDFEWESDSPGFSLEALCLPGVTLSRGFASSNRTVTADKTVGSDEYLLTWTPSRARAFAVQAGREVSTPEIVFGTYELPIAGTAIDDFPHINLRISNRALRARLPNADAKLWTHGIRPDDDAMRSLSHYIQTLDWELQARRADLGNLAAVHIIDLVAIVLGATGDGRHVAMGRGGRIAQLAAVKRSICGRHASLDLSIAAIAKEHSMSVRALQCLLAEDGTTFTDYLLEQRLTAAHHALQTMADPISSVAFATGFSDLSHFNHRYRARFGETPSDTRHRAASSRP